MGDMVGSSSYSDPTISKTDIAPLGEWFARPVKLFHYEWDEGVGFSTRFIPIWKDYFTTSIIRRKLEGYSRMRADLKVKVLVNGSPFRYGELMMSYRPLYSINGSGSNTAMPYFSGGMIAGDIITDALAGAYPDQDFVQVASDASTLMARSQRPNLRIQPHINSGGVMTIPFLYYKDAIEITAVDSERFAQRLREMGTLTIENLVTLRSTAEANATGVSVTIYAWAENVELWGPTGVTVQGIDEYETTLTPSEDASTVAEAAGVLSRIPIIKPYALATQFLAGVSAQSLKYFGWSNPPVLNAVPARMPKSSFLNPGPCHSYPDDVLALDGKNELTVDPRTVGADPKDPLIIESFAARSAIVDTIEWKVTDAPGTLLAQFPVQPCYYRVEKRSRTAPKLSSYRLTTTPATYLASMFEYWRGTMVLKLRTVASQFHRGRIAITWDPAAYVPDGTFKEASVVTHIIDLASASDMTIKIPFMSHFGMCRTQHFPFQIETDAQADVKAWTNRTTSFTWTANRLYDRANGLVEVRVLNHLQCGDATADVTIIAEIAFEDMTYMCPTVDAVSPAAMTSAKTSFLARLALTDYTAQGIEDVVVQGLEAPGVTEDMQMIAAGASEENVSKLYGGEAIPSLRSLLHRTYPYRVVSHNGSNSAFFSVQSVVLPRFPLPIHTKLNGFNDKIPVGAASDNTNMVITNPIALITACFTGYRGSMVWKAVADASTMIWMHRYAPEFSSTMLDSTSSSPDVDQVQTTYLAALCSNNGASWNKNDLAGTTGAVFPQYNNFRMMPGNPVTHYRKPSDDLMLEPFDNDGVKIVNVRSENANAGLRQRSAVMASVAAGTDFNVFHFVNVPDVYLFKGSNT